MLRRALAVTLLVLFAVLGAMTLGSVCPEPCPDDTEETSCPPICAVCTSCTHAQTAIVQHAAGAAPMIATKNIVSSLSSATPSQLADDIFHVPLRG
jgi:hypothetical protein